MDPLLDRIVTLKSLRLGPEQIEVVEAETDGREVAPEDQEALALYKRLRGSLRDATDEVEGADVMLTVRDREVSLAQSWMVENGRTGRRLPSGGAEVQFEPGVRGGDLGWIRSLWDWARVRGTEQHPILRPAVTAAETLTGDLTVGIVSDWGTGMYGAPVIAGSLRAMAAADKPFDLLMHLGDVYYAGTPREIDTRFLRLWPSEAGRLNRGLNGNHEMYSGGAGYFTMVLPTFKQKSSYFAFQNEHWLLVGLDTAYVDHDVDEEQVVWLDTVIKQAQGRKVVLFSHHQPFSVWSRPTMNPPRLTRSLRRVLAARLVTAWYWGHEHQCVIYDQHPRFGFHGRCLGNGGIPERRRDDVRDAPVDAVHPGRAGCTWRRMPSTEDAPGCLVLDGPNPDMAEQDREAFAPHGFMTLSFDGPVLTERVLRSDGAELYSTTIG